MAQHFVTMCVVCLFCAAHTPCLAHMEDFSQSVQGSTIPSADYTTELPGYSEHFSTDRIDKKVSQWSEKDSKGANNQFDKVPDNRNEDSYYDDSLEVELERVRNQQESRRRELLERLGQTDLQAINDKNAKNAKNSRSKRSSQHSDKYFTKKIFQQYGDGEHMTIDGFERLLKKMGLFQLNARVTEEESHSIDSNQSGSRLGKRLKKN